MKPLQHINCPQFDEALAKRAIIKTEPGFYVAPIEWENVPPEALEQVKQQVEALRVQQGLPADQKLKPLGIVVTCPFCGVGIVEGVTDGLPPPLPS